MSHRLSTPPEDVADPILDATRATIVDFGLRRTTVIEVARRAGVSRMTVYRRYPDADTLLRALMAREFGKSLRDAAVAGADAPDVRSGAVAEIREGVSRLIDHPVLRRLLEVDSELVLPYFTHEPGRFQRMAISRLSAVVEAGQADGSVRDGDPARLAATVELALRGVVLNAVRLAEDADREAVLDEIAALVDRYLAP